MGCCSSKNKCDMCRLKLEDKYIILSQFNTNMYKFCSEKCYKDLLQIIANFDMSNYQVKKIYINTKNSENKH